MREGISIMAACLCLSTALAGEIPRISLPKADNSGGLTHRVALQFNPRLGEVEARLEKIATQLQGLPVLTDMDALGSHGYHSNFTGDSESNWFRIEWERARWVDAVALVPTRLTTQSGEMSNYGFPRGLRIEAGLPGAPQPILLAEIEETHLETRRGEPVFLAFPPIEVLWIRVIPLDLPTLPKKHVRFFSISEFMAFDGPVNIAPSGTLSAGYSIDAEFGWNIRYLVDGQSPLGPPEKPPSPTSLGWHTDIVHESESSTWAAIDLGETLPIDGMRIIPAKGDSPVKGPGFGFPERFRIEVSDEDSPESWKIVWESGTEPFANPGYNPVLIHFDEVRARHVRLFVERQHQPDLLTAPRVLLSEIEVLQGFDNIALGKTATTPDRDKSRPHDATRVWSVAGLTDGHSSTGVLIPLRQWVHQLSLRFELTEERRRLVRERETILSTTHFWLLVTAFTLLGCTVIGLVIWQLRLRLSARRHIRELRRKISSDLHDEVGSNLATISLLAEIAPTSTRTASVEDISRLAREASLSLREIIDLTLTPKRARKPLPDRLREIAGLMLKDHEWSLVGDFSPELDPEQRRNLIFFFKESLHNIFRHAGAKHVEIRIEGEPRHFILTVADDGCGLPVFDSGKSPKLRTLEQRAESLRGTLEVRSKPGQGTRLELRFPLKTQLKP
jgi:signal transduction histidine kinase